MAFNLVEAIKSLFTEDLVNKTSTYLGESETGISRAFNGIIPTILGAVMDKSSSPGGAQELSAWASDQFRSGGFENLGSNFIAGTSPADGPDGLTDSIFGNNSSAIKNLLAGYANVKPGSINSILSMAVPAVLAFLGKYAADNSLNANGLASFLNTQSGNIQNAIPADLHLKNVYGNTAASSPVETTHSHAAAHAASHPVKEGKIYDERTGISKWIFPLFLLILLAVACWYLFGTGGSADSHATTHETTDATHAHAATTPKSTASTGGIDTLTGDYQYNVGNNVSIDLPGGAGKLEAGEFSTENKLYQFLSDESATLDTVKGNWFEFTNVQFKTGSAEITETSLTQLKNLVAISKAFPSARFKVGGYTDNTGNAAANVALSQKRADAVQAMLKKLGAAPAAITGAEGYGPQHPIGDNGTNEGRAMNRRVAINVKSK